MENDQPQVPVLKADDMKPPLLPPHRPAVVRVFIGPGGLRAGWRLLIYLALTFAIGFALGRLLLHGRHLSGPPGLILAEAVMFAAVFGAAGVMSFIEHRPLGAYGLPLRGAFGRRFWEGAAWGFLALSLLLLGIRATGDFGFGDLALHGRQIAWFAVTWGVAFLLVGLAEEFALRGYTMFTLTTGMGFWPAALVLSLVFAGVHLGNHGENAVGIVNVALVGLFFCFTLRRTGNLWFAVGFHAAWDWAESFFYGVPDSGEVLSGHLLSPVFHGSVWITGGSAGPEGSTLCVVLLPVLAALVALRFPTARYPEPVAAEVGPATNPAGTTP